MSGRPPGSEVGLTYDSPLHRLEPGDYLSTPTGRLYEVLDVRVQTRGAHAGRQHVRALVVTETRPPGTVYPLRWYTRARRSPRQA